MYTSGNDFMYIIYYYILCIYTTAFVTTTNVDVINRLDRLITLYLLRVLLYTCTGIACTSPGYCWLCRIPTAVREGYTRHILCTNTHAFIHRFWKPYLASMKAYVYIELLYRRNVFVHVINRSDYSRVYSCGYLYIAF